MRSPHVEALDSVVIGAGQAGLAASYFLRQRRIDHVVLDANPHPGGAWQHRWASLGMDDVHGVADLPGAPAPHGSGRAANVVVPDYFDGYERDQGLPVVRPVRVDSVTSDGDLLVVRAADRTWLTRTLVNATGTWTRPFVPFYPGIATFAGEQVHTAHYPGAEHFRGKRVLVVGGGASAVQFLGELAPLTDTLWVTRRPPVWRDEFDASAGTGRRHRGRGARTPWAPAGVRGERDRPRVASAGAGGGPAGRVRAAADVRPDRARRRPLGRWQGRPSTSTPSSGPPASGLRSTTSPRSACVRPRAGSRSSRCAATSRGRRRRSSTRACSWWATDRRRAPSAPRAPDARRRSRSPGSSLPTGPRWTG